MNIQNFIKQFFKNQLISYVDVGAADNIGGRWKKISKNLRFIGFEPNEKEFKKIKNNNFGKFKIFNFAVGDINGFKHLNILESSLASSFLEPDYKSLINYPNPERFKIKKKTKLVVKKLDSLRLNKIDFLKVDTQGYNLNVLKGAKTSLIDMLGVEVETEFMKIYKNQDLFEDIKKYLEKNNFYFVNFYNLRRWSLIKNFSYGKTIFCNSLFLKKLSSQDLKNHDKIIKFVIICILYNILDIAYFTVEKSFLQSSQKNKIKKLLKQLENKSFTTRIYVSFYNRLNKFLNKQNELFPTF